MSLRSIIDNIRSSRILDSLSDTDIIRLEIDLEEKRYDRWFEMCSRHPNSINELFHRAVIFNTHPDIELFMRQGVSFKYDYILSNGNTGNILYVCLENDQVEMFQKILYKDQSLLSMLRSDGANLLEVAFSCVEEVRDIPSFEEVIHAMRGFVNPKKAFPVRQKFLPSLKDPQFRLYTEMVRDVRKV